MGGMPLGSSHTENSRVDGSWLPVVLLRLHLWPGPAVSFPTHSRHRLSACQPWGRIGVGGGWIASHSCGQGKVC